MPEDHNIEEIVNVLAFAQTLEPVARRRFLNEMKLAVAGWLVDLIDPRNTGTSADDPIFEMLMQPARRLNTESHALEIAFAAMDAYVAGDLFAVLSHLTELETIGEQCDIRTSD